MLATVSVLARGDERVKFSQVTGWGLEAILICFVKRNPKILNPALVTAGSTWQKGYTCVYLSTGDYFG